MICCFSIFLNSERFVTHFLYLWKLYISFIMILYRFLYLLINLLLLLTHGVVLRGCFVMITFQLSQLHSVMVSKSEQSATSHLIVFTEHIIVSKCWCSEHANLCGNGFSHLSELRPNLSQACRSERVIIFNFSFESNDLSIHLRQEHVKHFWAWGHKGE